MSSEVRGEFLLSRHRQEDWLVEADGHTQPSLQPYFWEEELFHAQSYHHSVSDRKASLGLIYQGQRVWPGQTACCSIPLLLAGEHNIWLERWTSDPPASNGSERIARMVQNLIGISINILTMFLFFFFNYFKELDSFHSHEPAPHTPGISLSMRVLLYLHLDGSSLITFISIFIAVFLQSNRIMGRIEFMI